MRTFANYYNKQTDDSELFEIALHCDGVSYFLKIKYFIRIIFSCALSLNISS